MSRLSASDWTALSKVSFLGPACRHVPSSPGHLKEAVPDPQSTPAAQGSRKDSDAPNHRPSFGQ